MAHMIDNTTGRDAFAYMGEKAWHGLGVEIPEEAATDPQKIAELAGAAYHVSKRPVSFTDATGRVRTIDNRMAIVRDDTHEALEVLSDNKYNVVQPVEYFEAFRDSLAANHLRISSAGVLKGGRVVFVCAQLNDHGITVLGMDKVQSFVTLGGGYNGELPSFGYLSSYRTVCHNTLSSNLSQTGKAGRLFKVAHSQVFTAQDMTAALGLAGKELAIRADVFNTLAGRKAHAEEVARFFAGVVGVKYEDINAVDKAGKPLISGKARSMLAQLADAYANGPGATLPSAQGTVWGALNAVTHWVDHIAPARDTYADGTDAARFASAQFGAGADRKQAALYAAMELAGLDRTRLAVAA